MLEVDGSSPIIFWSETGLFLGLHAGSEPPCIGPGRYRDGPHVSGPDGTWRARGRPPFGSWARRPVRGWTTGGRGPVGRSGSDGRWCVALAFPRRIPTARRVVRRVSGILHPPNQNYSTNKHTWCSTTTAESFLSFMHLLIGGATKFSVIQPTPPNSRHLLPIHEDWNKITGCPQNFIFIS